ncbi:Transposase DDE domain-containing protein [Burkholderia sp. GAS332]|nr:Transposase DDE domain-containing protein [Burkholderia sp. GAS332]
MADALESEHLAAGLVFPGEDALDGAEALLEEGLIEALLATTLGRLTSTRIFGNVGAEPRVYGDSAYASQKEVIASKAPHAKDFTNQRGRRRSGEVDDGRRSKNRNKSKIRARVEHVFAVVNRLWGFVKVHYCGLAKNATRAFTAMALSNIYMSPERLIAHVRS